MVWEQSNWFSNPALSRLCGTQQIPRSSRCPPRLPLASHAPPSVAVSRLASCSCRTESSLSVKRQSETRYFHVSASDDDDRFDCVSSHTQRPSHTACRCLLAMLCFDLRGAASTLSLFFSMELTLLSGIASTLPHPSGPPVLDAHGGGAHGMILDGLPYN